MYPMIDWDGDSKCRKPPRFTDKNADARQALADGNAQSGQAPIPVPVTAQQDAQALDETTNNENPCTAAVDYAACSEALAHDEAGIETYEATEGVLADDPLQVAATAAQNGQVVVSSIVRTYDDGTTVIEATDLIEDNSHLDAAGNSAEYTAYETEYGLPDMESAPESESLPEPGPGTVTP